MKKVIFGIMGFVGAILLILAVGTSDYHVMVLNNPEPAYIRWTITAGITLIIPALVSAIKRYLKEVK